ncbi:MAG: hypothetical protein KatS3mg121_1109 [Gammaproteobacteria bacterium]|nr:MAG: hypothetical protein KatS3mg121_1109 [Gammaproteobacteria bacterium]
MNPRRRFVSCVLAAALAACGWRLRAPPALPPGLSPLAVEADPSAADLARAVRRQLRGAGVALAPPGAAAATLALALQRGQRVAALGPDGRAREYEVYYRARFALRRGAETVVPEQSLEVRRELVYDPLAVSAVDEERVALERAMAEDLARLVVERLAAAFAP